MDEYNPYAEFLNGLTADLLPSDVLALPPMAGASPGLLDDLKAIGGISIEHALKPALEWIGDQLSGVLKEVWAATEAVWHRVTWWVYKRLYLSLSPFLIAGGNATFFHPDTVGALASHFFLGETFRLLVGVSEVIRDAGLKWIQTVLQAALGYAGAGYTSVHDMLWRTVNEYAGWVWTQVRAGLGYAAVGYTSVHDMLWRTVNEYAGWVWTQVKDGLGYAGAGYTSLTSAVYAGIENGAAWVYARVRDALGFAAHGFGNMADFVASQFSGLGTWIFDSIITPVGDELAKIPGYLVAGAQDIAGFFEEGFRRVFLGPLEALEGTVNAKLAIPGKLLRGEYADAAAFFDDIIDPPPEMLRGFTAVLMIPFIISGLIVAASTRLGGELLEPVLQEQARNVGAQLLTVSEVHEAWNRGIIDEATALDQLGRRGYGHEALPAQQALRFRLPPLTDLTRMAVREVFDPGQRAALTLDADYPGELTGHARAIGLDEEWSRNYWAAHWDLPSPTQGYEMLHRGRIDTAELDALLKALDFAPVWREHLREIAYLVPGRIDLRRLYKAGIYTREQVFRGYQDLGYKPDVAEALTEFAVKLATPDATSQIDELADLTVASIRQFYRRHVIDRDQALEAIVGSGVAAEVAELFLAYDDAQLAINPLTDAGVPVRDLSVTAIRQAYRDEHLTYDAAVAELEAIGVLGAEADVLLAHDDLQLARDLTNAEIALVRERYIGFTVDAAGARAELAQAGIGPRRQDLLLAEWAVEAEKGSRRLTVPEVFRARAAGRFSDDQAFAYLLRLGYNQADADEIFTARTAA